MATERIELRAHIIDAAARLLQERGAAALTTRAVADAAEVQAPTIYRLFNDKDGLIDAVAEHVMATHVAAKTTIQEPADPVEALRAAWMQHIDFGLANPDLYELLNAPGRRPTSPATEAGIEVLRSRIRRLAEVGVLRVDEELALGLIHAAGSGAVLALLRSQRRDERLAQAMLDAVLWRIVDESVAPQVSGETAATAVMFATHVPTLPGLTDAERAVLGEWLARSIAVQQRA